MAQLDQHPTVKQYRAREVYGTPVSSPQKLDREWLYQLCLEVGADDAGFVAIDRPEIAEQKADIQVATSKCEIAHQPCCADESRKHSHACTLSRKSGIPSRGGRGE